MIYTDMTRLAMQIAYQAHHGQVDRANVPYVFHPLHLAEQMPTELATTVALLHDVVEDTTVTVADLRVAGFPEAVLEAVDLLTHKVGDSYAAYIDSLKDNDLARLVKLADLYHNMNKDRQGALSEEEIAYREKKYPPALAVLLELQPQNMLAEQRLASFEHVYQAVQAALAQTEQDLAKLKANGQLKSLRYRELTASKYSLQGLLAMFQAEQL